MLNRRLTAGFIDIITLSIVVLFEKVSCYILLQDSYFIKDVSDGVRIQVYMLRLLPLAAIILFIIFEARFGYSLGKFIVKLRVEGTNLILRAIIKWIFFAIGFIGLILQDHISQLSLIALSANYLWILIWSWFNTMLLSAKVLLLHDRLGTFHIRDCSKVSRGFCIK